MIVNYNGTGANSISLANARYISFMPGANEVEKELWEEALKNPLVKSCVELGIYTAEKSVDTSEDAQKITIEMINNCCSVETLNKWISKGVRRSIESAIDARIKLLTEIPEENK